MPGRQGAIPGLTRLAQPRERREGDMGQWKATHRIHKSSGSVDVMLTNEGPAYTREEWEAFDASDHCVANGEWLFMGQPFACEIEKL